MQTLVEDVLYLVVDGRVVRLNLIVGRDTDSLAVGTECKRIDVGTAEERTQSGSYLLGLYLLLKNDNIVAATGKVDTLAQATYEEAAYHYKDNRTEDDERCLAV